MLCSSNNPIVCLQTTDLLPRAGVLHATLVEPQHGSHSVVCPSTFNVQPLASFKWQNVV